MRTFRLLLAAGLLLAAAPGLSASSPSDDGSSSSMPTPAPASSPTPDFRTRTSAGIDWKITRGLHLNAGYELRTADCLKRIERHQLNIGLDYSPLKYLSIGGGYSYIAHFDSNQEYKPRHRVYLALTGSYKFGGWKLSLRENLQLTHKSYDVNEYQTVPNLLELKSRIKCAYKGWVHLAPYAYFEVRNCFNGPSFTADYNATTGKYSHYQFTGYSDAYVNRLRGAIGLEWIITRSHSIDFKLMEDWCRDKAIDTNAEGTKLKSYCWEEALNTSLCIAYVFSF